ncbi:hypothetical protein HPO96_01785 [Kribbella sandramycini]|uniref:Uncharacterized protein n=1 Tax=Kribbella sandramycini TaxID=60450 RepID=A0A7Y4KVX1_9ACTN|nr:hypothetical protein [Kribbella sandramycini]MBB6568443.1 hypothetical protein [Kribbella sandramycini]NOL38967.1 hypothetical protein [Kribbella sandramycini]
MKTHQTYVLDHASWSRVRVVTACRQVLDVFRPDAAIFECDIPIDDSEWPPEVQAAAQTLRVHAQTNGKRERGGYAMTGVTPATHPTWPAFATFCPFSYDATVWDHQGRDLISLADEATCFTLTLTHPQYQALTHLPDIPLVPLHTWRRTR